MNTAITERQQRADTGSKNSESPATADAVHMIAAMLKSLARFIVLLCMPAVPATAAEPWPGPVPHPAPPVAQTVPHVVRSAHGQRDDEYHWLRDDDRKDAAMLAYLEAENAWTDAVMAPLKPLQDTL